MSIWQHLFPPFDAWWPNIIASAVVFVPTTIVHHVLLKRHFRNKLAEHLRMLLDGEETSRPD